MDRKTPTYILAPDQSWILCLRCGKTSYNKNDVEQRYCGQCNQMHTTAQEDLDIQTDGRKFTQLDLDGKKQITIVKFQWNFVIVIGKANQPATPENVEAVMMVNRRQFARAVELLDQEQPIQLDSDAQEDTP